MNTRHGKSILSADSQGFLKESAAAGENKRH